MIDAGAFRRAAKTLSSARPETADGLSMARIGRGGVGASMIVPRPLALAGLLPLVLAAAAPPVGQAQHIKYRVEIFGPAGLHVATNRTELDQSGDTYTIKASIETRGLAGWFVTMKSNAQAKGRLSADAAQPESFRADTERNGVEHHEKITYATDGGVNGSSAPPSKEPVKPVPSAQMRGTVDNLTAYFLLERQLGRGGKCDLTVAVFDGRQRYDLKFTDGGQQKLSPASGQNFAGVTTLCHMKRVEIAGFPTKAEDSEGARSGTLWYARLVPGNLVQGIRMEMETEAGQISAYLAEVQANGADLKLME
jgi:hypothetical protein